MARVVNRSELAELFGVALTTIDLWINEGMPYLSKPERKGGSGWRIDAGQVLQWHREKERQRALGEMAEVDEKEIKRRKLAAQAALIEHELALKTGAVVTIADQAKVWSAFVAACRARLLALGNKLGPIVAVESDALSCQSLIDTAVYEALQELTDFEPPPIDAGGDPEPVAGNPDDSAPVGAPAKADDQRVGGPVPKAKPRSKRRTRPVDHKPR